MTTYPPLLLIKDESNFTVKDAIGQDILIEEIGTDDSTVINAALELGSLTLPQGTYTIKNTISVPEDTILSGTGWKTIVTQPTDTQIAVGSPLITINGGGICRNLKVDGNSDNVDTNGVYLKGTAATVYNCEITDVRQYAAWSYKGTSPRILNCKIHDCRYPISLTGAVLESDGWTSGGIIFGNYTYNATLYNKIRASRDCSFSNNYVVVSVDKGSGVVLSGGDAPYKNIKITDNIIVSTIEPGTGYGIYAKSDDNSISENILVENNILSGGFILPIKSDVKNTSIGNNLLPL